MADPPDDGKHNRSLSPREDFDPLSDDRESQGIYTDHTNASQESASGMYDDLIEAQLDDDGGPESLGTRYGVTPPMPRITIREKQRSGSSKGSHLRRSDKENREQQQPAKRKSQHRVSVIKDAHLGDPTLVKLCGFDSDDNIDAETFREKREKKKKDSREMKKQTKSRDHDRSMKRMSDDFTGLDMQVPLDSSGRFSHLMARPVVAVSPETCTRREWMEPVACAKNRVEFSETFGILINLGTQAKADRENKLAASTKRQMSLEQEQWKNQVMDMMWIELNAYLHGRCPEEEQNQLRVKREEGEAVLERVMRFQFTPRPSSLTASQASSPVQSRRAIGNNQRGADCLRAEAESGVAVVNGQRESNVSAVSIQGESDVTAASIQGESDVAAASIHGDSNTAAVSIQWESNAAVGGMQDPDSMSQFPVSVSESGVASADIGMRSDNRGYGVQTSPGACAPCGEAAYPGAYFSGLSVNSVCTSLDDSVAASFHEVILTRDMVQLQQEALIEVQKVLDRLDSCERLYPTMKQIALDYPQYGQPEFTKRVESLNLWLNITCDLCHKLKLFGRIIGAEQHGFDWPVINFDFPFPHFSDSYNRHRLSVPNIEENTETSESDEEDEEEGEEGEGAEVNETCDEGMAESEQGRKTRLLSPAKQVKFSCGSDSGTSSRDASPNPRSVAGPEPGSAVHPGTPSGNSRSSLGSFNTSLSRASSDISLEGVSGRSPVYRHYVDKCLKKMGMKKLVMRLRDIFDCTLQRAKEALQSPRYADLKRYPSNETGLQEHEKTSSPSLGRPHLSFGRSTSLAEHGEWCQEFRRMGLPSFRPSYLFLLRIPLDIVHECLRLRLEQRPQGIPSYLSIRQLIRECREVLFAATVVKQYYQYMLDPVIWDEQEAEEKFASHLEQFDTDLKQMLQVYFSFLQSWIDMLQSLAESSQHLQSVLEDEWNFTRSTCVYIIGGEAEAGKRFSALASNLLTSTADFLDNGIDENTKFLYDTSSVADDDDVGSDEESNDSNNNDTTPSIEGGDYSSTPRVSAEAKQAVQVALRSFKNLFHEARERATKALGFAKKLRKDLEIAADYDVTVTMTELFEKLSDTKHARLRVPLSAGYMMFVPHTLEDNPLVLQLLNVTSGRDDTAVAQATAASMEVNMGRGDLGPSREEGYLLLVRCEAGIDHVPACPQWRGKDILVEPTAETAIALSHIQVEGLLYVVIRSSLLGRQRREFESLMGPTVKLVSEQTTCHQAIAESLSGVKLNALNLQQKVAEAIRQVDNKLNFDIIAHEDNLLKLYRETMLQCYNFGFEYSKEVMRLIAADQRPVQCKALFSFAKDWMTFAMQKCDSGRGMRPRWATQGFDFLTSVCDPKFLAYLTDEEFHNFQQTISNCVTHVIGTIEQRPVAPGLSTPRSHGESRSSLNRFMSWNEGNNRTGHFHRSTSARSTSSEPSGRANSGLSTPSTPSPQPDVRLRRPIMTMSQSEVNIHDGPEGGLVMNIHHSQRPASAGDMESVSRGELIRRQIDALEKNREARLRETKRIGHVTDKKQEQDSRFDNVRHVKFRWQRGNKIGQGQFGKVYTAVNMSTGELMAIKEMKFLPYDQQQQRMMSDEIKNFEGIQHENLVKYYGVEVYKDEMLMFMEYCDTGTIEEAAKMGLPEYLIRRYTREIVLAVNHLHENSIVHRDIKGANIFLTSSGHVKLGDFGLSVKLRCHTTIPGEFYNLAGTTAYMAPEVITKNEQRGYGRAADIWSLGCVVIEMASGKRPWPELENMFQIMFKVGVGHSPAIPDSLSPEGKEFVTLTLNHDPDKRPAAIQLLDHTFTKVYNEPEEDEEEESIKKTKKHQQLVPKESSESEA